MAKGKTKVTSLEELANTPMWQSVDGMKPIKDLENDHLAKSYKTVINRLSRTQEFRKDNANRLKDFNVQVEYNQVEINKLYNKITFHQQEIYRLNREASYIKERDSKNDQSVQTNNTLLKQLEAELKRRNLSIQEIFDEINKNEVKENIVVVEENTIKV